jgi:Type II CAAX prenyl endopeptidase Rce1-like
MSNDSVKVAALVTLPFLVVLAVAQLLAPPSAEQIQSADPLVAWFRSAGGVWAIVGFGVLVAAGWLIRGRPAPAELRRGLLRAGIGCGAALVVAFAIRVVVGPHLPSFIPPEESARPGFTQGLAAGLFEEVAFRLVVLPVSFRVLERRVARWPAAAGAILVTALGFALSHELGPGAAPFRVDRFATRAIFPGAVMSVAFFWPGPAFIVAAHATAHLVIPILFL